MRGKTKEPSGSKRSKSTMATGLDDQEEFKAEDLVKPDETSVRVRTRQQTTKRVKK